MDIVIKTIVTVVVAFASGVLGSSLGAVGAVIMTAVAALAGIVGNISGADVNLVNEIAFGMFLGPQVSFGPACCAAAYAKKRGYLESSKSIATPLISLKHYDVLVVGGLFAVLGWYMNLGIAKMLPGIVDTVALTVVLISLIAKIIFGGNGIRSAIGVVPDGQKRYSIFNEQVWIPYQTAANGIQLLIISGSVGAISGYIVQLFCTLAEQTGNTALADASTLPVWAIAVICFLLNAHGLPIPVFHHIGLVAGYAAKMAFMGGGTDGTCILWAISFGILAAYAGDFLAKTFTVFGEGFVDPPSMAIALCSILPLMILPKAGADKPENMLYFVIPIALLVVFVIVGIYQDSKYHSKKSSQKTNVMGEVA